MLTVTGNNPQTENNQRWPQLASARGWGQRHGSLKPARGDGPPSTQRQRTLPGPSGKPKVTRTPSKDIRVTGRENVGGACALPLAHVQTGDAGAFLSPGAGRRGQRQALGLLQRAVLAGFCGKGHTEPADPLYPPRGSTTQTSECGGCFGRSQKCAYSQSQEQLVAAAAPTSAGLQLAGQHFADLIHPRGFNFRGWCLRPGRNARR